MTFLSPLRRLCNRINSPECPKIPQKRPACEKPTKIGISHRKSAGIIDRRISVAPMMDWTDRHCRYFLRGFSPDVLLYTEMITAAAILRGDRDASAWPSIPKSIRWRCSSVAATRHELAAAARIGEEAGYDEINLNCGCPSDRVASGAFGACLMLRARAGRGVRGGDERRGARPRHREDAHRCGERGTRRGRAARSADSTSATIERSGALRRQRCATRAARSRSCTRARPCSVGCRRRTTARSRRCATTSCARLQGEFPHCR